MHLDDFAFDLPRELIADRPAEPRDTARLLVLPAAGGLLDRHIADLPELLRPGDLLVFNDTKVIPARLVGRRGQATVEITLAMERRAAGWRAYAKGARRLRPGESSSSAVIPPLGISRPRSSEKTPEGEVILRFDREGEAFRDALARHGAMPPLVFSIAKVISTVACPRLPTSRAGMTLVSLNTSRSPEAAIRADRRCAGRAARLGGRTSSRAVSRGSAGRSAISSRGRSKAERRDACPEAGHPGKTRAGLVNSRSYRPGGCRSCQSVACW